MSFALQCAVLRCSSGRRTRTPRHWRWGAARRVRCSGRARARPACARGGGGRGQYSVEWWGVGWGGSACARCRWPSSTAAAPADFPPPNPIHAAAPAAPPLVVEPPTAPAAATAAAPPPPPPPDTHTHTLAVRRQEIASFLTSSVVGSRCILYLARGCQRSYCACRFLPAGERVWVGGGGEQQFSRRQQQVSRETAAARDRELAGSSPASPSPCPQKDRTPRCAALYQPMVSRALGACMDSGSTQHSRRAQGEILMTSGGSTPAAGHRGTGTVGVVRGER